MYVCMYVCIYIYMYVCTYVCMYVCRDLICGGFNRRILVEMAPVQTGASDFAVVDQACWY